MQIRRSGSIYDYVIIEKINAKLLATIRKITHLLSDAEFYESRLKIANLIYNLYIDVLLLVPRINHVYINVIYDAMCRNNNKGFKDYKSKLNKLKIRKKSR